MHGASTALPPNRSLNFCPLKDRQFVEDRRHHGIICTIPRTPSPGEGADAAAEIGGHWEGGDDWKVEPAAVV